MSEIVSILKALWKAEEALFAAQAAPENPKTFLEGSMPASMPLWSAKGLSRNAFKSYRPQGLRVRL